MDDIQACNINCVTTECGHQFHTSCLMRNVAHNGFGCPYCRNVMADEVEDSDDDEYTEMDDDEETIISDVSYDPQSPDNDRALSGMRSLFRRAQNDIENAADDEDEDDEDYYDDDDVIKLTSQQITDTLTRANYTMADIVKAYTIVTGYYQNGEDETDEQVNEFMEKFEDHMNKLQTGDIPPVLPITISVKEEKLDMAEPKVITKQRLIEFEECL
jgi:hypothetical protein